MRQIVLDTETTGLSFQQGHRIVEIGCVELKNYIPTGSTYQVYINPERSMDPSAIQVSGITDDFLQDKQKFKDVVGDFCEFIKDSPLVIHNARFDLGFINGEFGLLNRAPLDFSRAIDTVKMARAKFPGSPANLDALCRRFEIDISGREKHGALLDAHLLAEVYLQLIGGRQFGLTLDKKINDNNQVIDLKSLPLRESRNFKASDEEIEKHKAFIESFKTPLWKKFA